MFYIYINVFVLLYCSFHVYLYFTFVKHFEIDVDVRRCVRIYYCYYYYYHKKCILFDC